MGTLRNRVLSLPRILKKPSWPQPTAVAERLDASQLVEEEQTPYYDRGRFYPARLGEILNKRYQLVNKAGHGSSSTVWIARDLNQWRWGKEKFVALKINANLHHSRKDAAAAELSMYRHIAKTNPRHEGWHFVRQLLDSFTLEGKAVSKPESPSHTCLVFEPLREPLWLYQTRFPGGVLPVWRIKLMLEMLLKALDYLHTECRIIHADLKTDNIMVKLENTSVLEEYARDELFEYALPQKICPEDGRIIYLSRNNYGPSRGVTGIVKITDFDLSVRGDQENSGCIGAEIYRAPEVIVDAGYGYSADIWTLGVLLWDMMEGKKLFKEVGSFSYDGEYDETKHLAQITALLGPAPQALLHGGKRTSMFYDPDGTLKDPSAIPGDMNFENTITGIDREEKLKFLNFAKRMIKWKPEERSTAKELLADPWLAA